MNALNACILASGVFDTPVKAVTCCLISGDGSRRPWLRLLYQTPISFQLTNPRLAPPGGMMDRIINPATPFQGGISASHFTSGMSFRIHCHWPLAEEAGARSE